MSSKELKERLGHAMSADFNPEEDLQKVGVANQTTMLMSETMAVGEKLRRAMVERYGEENLKEHFELFDTICSATQDRQDALFALLEHPLDIAVIIGGYNSSNTNNLASLCLDHPEVQAMIPKLDRRIVTYGFSPQADVRAEKVLMDRMGATFNVVVQDRTTGRARTMKPMRLPMLGQHNVQNALAAIAVGVEMDIDEETIRSALASFKGVKRRFTRVGEAGGVT